MVSKKELLRKIEDLSEKIENIDNELDGDFKEENSNYSSIFNFYPIFSKSKVPTINSKVDSIIKYLGLDVSVKEIKESNKIVVKSNKKPVISKTKKAGK